MNDTLAYADGSGRWHVLTRDTPMGLTRAVDTIVAELDARGENSHGVAREYLNRNIVSLPLSEWDSSPAFRGFHNFSVGFHNFSVGCVHFFGLGFTFLFSDIWVYFL